MRVTFLTGQSSYTTDLGPIVTPSAFPPGAAGQVVGYGPGGVPQAVTLPAGTLPPGTDGQIVGYAAGGTPTAIDPTIPLATANW